MIYLKLFFAFLKIGTFSFGGGYGMISLIRETVLENGWLEEKELLDFIAVSESTPGPLAVNMATFIGTSQAGLAGGLVATIGVVLPAFFIILFIAAILKEFSKNKYMQGVLHGVRPAVTAMILSTAGMIGLSTLFSFAKLGDCIEMDIRGIGILFILVALHLGVKKRWNKEPSPIVMILLSAVMGGMLWGLLWGQTP